MALANRITETPARNHGLPCSVGALVEQLDGTERDALLTMLGTPEQRGWSAGDIHRVLREEGYEVAYQTINRHRGGKCRCSVGAA